MKEKEKETRKNKNQMMEKLTQPARVGLLTQKLKKMNLKPALRDWVAALPRSAPPAPSTQTPISNLKTVEQKYELLDTLFDGLAFAIRLLRLNGSAQTFSSIKSLIEQMTKRRFTYTHLSQFKFILPDVIGIDKTLIRDYDWKNVFKHDLLVTFKPNPATIHVPINDDNDKGMWKSVKNDEISQITKLFQSRLKTFYESISHEEDVDVPSLVLTVDSYSNPDATVLQVSFPGSLDALTVTINGLKHLGLDVAKQTITTEGSIIHTRVLVTQTSTGRKVENSDLLDNLRLTIISDLLKYNQEPRMGEGFGTQAPLKKLDVV